MATHHSSPTHCPICQQAVTRDAQDHLSAPMGVMVSVPLTYLVEQANLIATLQGERAEAQFKTIDHTDD